MTTKQILEYACLFLGKEELLNSAYFINEGEQLTEENTKDLNLLKRCLDLVISEIASDYMPIIKSKEIEFENFACQISSIDNSIQEIISIKSKTGKNLFYKIVDNKIICKTNLADVEYKVYPSKSELNGDCENFGGRIPDRVIAYGVCMEYCLVSLLFDDAQIWENRYKSSLLINSRKKSEMKLKKRRFI